MTELSRMLISGSLAEGGSVRIGVDKANHSLTYTVQNGANGTSKRNKLSGAPGLDAHGYMSNKDDTIHLDEDESMDEDD